MPNWEESMTQFFEYYIVDPDTWTEKLKLNNVKSCSISRDSSLDTLGNASLDVDSYLGECYVRVYFVTVQNGIRDRIPLGTYLVQTPSFSFDGKARKYSLDTYSPLLELKDTRPSLGFCIRKGQKALEQAQLICRQYSRAPFVPVFSQDDVLERDFVSNNDDTWLTFLIDLLSNVKYHLDLDETGRILFAPDQDIETLQPVWTYNDDNSSLLYPDITNEVDLYGIPNTLEVIYSDSNSYLTSIVVNDDENSPVSVTSRGRTVLYRDSNPNFMGIPTQQALDEYAAKTLRAMSAIECTLSYKHGYNGVRVGDCVRMNYERAGLIDVKAKVISQEIDCATGCSVSEKAVYTKKLWG